MLGRADRTRVCDMSEIGTFLIADVSGYTEYLAGSGLEHGPEIATDLITRVVASVHPAFELNRIEGDAVFAVSTDAHRTGVDVMEVVDNTYLAFRRRLQSVARATSCGCAACGLMPRLDLKVVIHTGAFSRQSIAGRTELVGIEVIVAHRLLKNSLGFAGPGSGYVLITDAATEAFGVDPAGEGLARHEETYDHIGTVAARVGNLQSRLERRGSWISRTPVIHETRTTLAGPAAKIWDLLTLERGGSCIASRLDSIDEVLEWRPSDRCVVEVRMPEATLIHEIALEPGEAGTEVTIRWFEGSDDHDTPWEEVGARLAAATAATLEDIAVDLDR